MDWTPAKTLEKLFLLCPFKAAIRIRSEVLCSKTTLNAGDASVTIYFAKVGNLSSQSVTYNKKEPWKQSTLINIQNFFLS